MTFLAQKPRAALTTPYKSPDKELAIVSVSDREICSAVILSPGTGTTDLMTFLEKQFGKGITTRSWTTILKLPP
ncbi:MAG TPA: hypothetical protein VGX97_05590 [bacterium]|nr:hypothetical protein [bacterium]